MWLLRTFPGGRWMGADGSGPSSRRSRRRSDGSSSRRCGPSSRRIGVARRCRWRRDHRCCSSRCRCGASLRWRSCRGRRRSGIFWRTRRTFSVATRASTRVSAENIKLILRLREPYFSSVPQLKRCCCQSSRPRWRAAAATGVVICHDRSGFLVRALNRVTSRASQR